MQLTFKNRSQTTKPTKRATTALFDNMHTFTGNTPGTIERSAVQLKVTPLACDHLMMYHYSLFIIIIFIIYLLNQNSTNVHHVLSQ